MSGYLKLKDYFAQMAKLHKEIKDFSGYFAREIQHKMSSFNGIGSPFVAIYDYELGLEGSERHTLGERKLTLSVLYSNSTFDDFEKQQQAIDNAEKIALQLLARIKRDSNDTSHFLYNSFQKELTKIYPVEDPALQVYGVDIHLCFVNSEPLSIDSNAWEDAVKGC